MNGRSPSLTYHVSPVRSSTSWRMTARALTAHLPWLPTAPHLTTVRAADAYGPSAGLLETTGVPHVWSVRGWNGAGVKTAPEAGRRIAEAVVTAARSAAA